MHVRAAAAAAAHVVVLRGCGALTFPGPPSLGPGLERGLAHHLDDKDLRLIAAAEGNLFKLKVDQCAGMPQQEVPGLGLVLANEVYPANVRQAVLWHDAGRVLRLILVGHEDGSAGVDGSHDQPLWGVLKGRPETDHAHCRGADATPPPRRRQKNLWH